MTSLLALIKTYVVGTQKYRLTEMIHLSTHNIGFGDQIRIKENVKHSLSRALVYMSFENIMEKQDMTKQILPTVSDIEIFCTCHSRQLEQIF